MAMRATSHHRWQVTTTDLHERTTARDDHASHPLLRSPSQFHDLDAAGVATPRAGSTC